MTAGSDVTTPTCDHCFLFNFFSFLEGSSGWMLESVVLGYLLYGNSREDIMITSHSKSLSIPPFAVTVGFKYVSALPETPIIPNPSAKPSSS